jgi:hypothetical protein
MIAFEVKLNGNRICIAGADDLCVLTTTIVDTGRLGVKTVSARQDHSAPDLFYSVGGLTRRPDPKKDIHVRWKSVAPLRVDDLLEVKVVEVTKVDPPKSRVKAEPRPGERKRSKPLKGRYRSQRDKRGHPE